MAKIVYGVSGQGFGHSTRSKEILKHLVESGHQVLVFTYGQALFFLNDDFDVFEVPGLGLSYKENKLVYWRTVYQAVNQLAKQSRHWKKILNRFRDFKPDVVFTDFEPLTAMLAKLQRLPLISVDNQHQFTNTKINIGGKYHKDFLTDKLIIKSMVWGADYYLITTFFETPIKNKKTFLFPPIVRSEVSKLKPSQNDYILVYQNSDFRHLVTELKKIDQKFVLFGMNKEGVDGNIEFKNYSHHEWLSYLAGCKAIVATAGLSLISESLYLKKPYLAVPVRKQTEQIINSQYLKKSGYGSFSYRFREKDYYDFMANFDVFRYNLSKYNYSGNQEILAKIDELIKKFS